MELHNELKTFHAKTRKEWRNWLERNHQSEKSIWLIIYKKESETPSIYYPEAVDEALCFGWIDSKPNKRDDKSFYLFFAKRKPKSNWSALNKTRVEKLLAAGKMHASGQFMVDLAIKTGTWDALNEVEDLILPKDLQIAFSQNQVAFENFQGFPKSVKRGILEWILIAKRPETRQKRIEETVRNSASNIRTLFPPKNEL
jgi:uncharacterized protein YdeI (YjbR/CyaY-like superfamily)